MHDRRCLLLTTILGWLVKILARCVALRNGGVGLGRLRFQQLGADGLWLRAAFWGGCCGLLFLVFSCFKSSNILRSRVFPLVRASSRTHFGFTYWIAWTALKLIWIKNKTCFWEKGKKAQEPLVFIRSSSSPTSVMQLAHNYVWRLEWNFWIWHCCAVSSVKKKFMSVCNVKFSEEN